MADTPAYARSNGNGPLHIVAEDGSAVLCGVKRFSAQRLYPRSPRDVCTACRRARKRADHD